MSSNYDYKALAYALNAYEHLIMFLDGKDVDVLKDIHNFTEREVWCTYLALLKIVGASTKYLPGLEELVRSGSAQVHQLDPYGKWPGDEDE